MQGLDGAEMVDIAGNVAFEERVEVAESVSARKRRREWSVLSADGTEGEEQRRRWSGQMGVEGRNGGVEDGERVGWAEQVGRAESVEIVAGVEGFGSSRAGKTLVEMAKSVEMAEKAWRVEMAETVAKVEQVNGCGEGLRGADLDTQGCRRRGMVFRAIRMDLSTIFWLSGQTSTVYRRFI